MLDAEYGVIKSKSEGDSDQNRYEGVERRFKRAPFALDHIQHEV